MEGLVGRKRTVVGNRVPLASDSAFAATTISSFAAVSGHGVQSVL